MDQLKNDTSATYAELVDLQSRFGEITNRKLDARMLHTYADDALSDLVALVENILTRYREYSITDTRQNGLEQERTALIYFDLDPEMIESTLDHIDNVAESTRNLASVIARKRQHIPAVILPPNTAEMNAVPGEGGIGQQKEIIPKLETLLLLLKEGFGIDIETDDEVSIHTGSLQPNMMRKISYDMIEISSLNRLVLSCDEIGNATFIFDTDICRELGIAPEDLAECTKDDLKSFLSEDARLGRVIRYSNMYVDRLAGALLDEFSDNEEAPEEEVQSFEILKPQAERAPKGYLSLYGMARNDDIAPQTLIDAIAALGGQLGEVKEYIFYSRTALGYSPEQQQMIIDFLDYPARAPEGFLSATGISREYGTANKRTVAKAIAALRDQLGEVKEYRFGAHTVPGYSPEQQRIILDYLLYLDYTPAPEGFLSLKGMGEKYEVDTGTLEKIIVELGVRLGEVKKYRFQANIVPGYSPEQQQIVFNHLNFVEQAPDGYLSTGGMANQYSLSDRTISRVVDILDGRIGIVKKYRFQANTVPGYSPEQQRLILEYINAHSKRVKLGRIALEFLNSTGSVS